MRPIPASFLAILLSTGASASMLATIPSAEQARARAAGLEVVQDYGDFALVRGHSDLAQVAARSGLAMQPDPHGYQLTLPYGQTQDPQERAPFSRQAPPELADGFALVQFQGPILPRWLDELTASGVEVIQYIHPYTYIVYQHDQALTRASRQQSAIRWIGQWPLSARVPPGLDTRSDTLSELRVISRTVSVPGRPALHLGGVNVLDADAIDRNLSVQRVLVAASRIPQLAALPEVLSVQPVPTGGGTRSEISVQQVAGNIDANQMPVPGYLSWLAGLSLNGNGVRLASVDDGVLETHPVLANRIAPCTGSTCGGAGGADHGTHTAAIMVGDGSDGVVAFGTSMLRGLGVAPGATLVEQLISPTSGLPNGMLTLMKESFSNGAVLSNNSWGTSDKPLGYDSDTRQVDSGVRDTDAATAGDQPLIYVLSIANGDGGVSSQGAPDEAKNTITVGATYSQLATVNVHTGSPHHWQDLSALTAHGPALDGRRIPHLVSAGDSVDSAVTFPTQYARKSGASMAAPHVSGALALYIQGYQQRTGVRPSAALSKAALLAATRDLSGRKDADGALLGHRPDNKQGWGQLQLDRLLRQLDKSIAFDQKTVFTSTGQSWSVLLEPRSVAEPLQVLLAYTDAPGHGTCASSSCTTPAWNNDLNLEVTAGVTTYKGNVFNSQGWAASGGVADEKNNAEAVLFEPGRITAPMTVTIRAANISSDALPNSSGNLQQDFALFCSNCRDAPIFRNGLE